MIDDIVTGIKLLFKPGQLVEIRGKRLDGTIFSKFFTDHERMARVLTKVDEEGEEAIWYSVQELNTDVNWQNKQQFGLATNRDDRLPSPARSEPTVPHAGATEKI
jgi:hypothetical protein